jgi:hypothetical protein
MPSTRTVPLTGKALQGIRSYFQGAAKDEIPD